MADPPLEGTVVIGLTVIAIKDFGVIIKTEGDIRLEKEEALR